MLLTQGTRSPYGHEQSEEFSPVQNLNFFTNYIPEKLRDVFTVAAGSSSVEEWVTLRRFSFTKHVNKKVSYFLIIISFHNIIYVTLTGYSLIFFISCYLRLVNVTIKS